MHSGTRAFTPEPRAPPQLRQNFFKGMCLSNTWSMFVLLTSTTPRSFYFAEYESLTAEVKKLNEWNGSWLAPFLGCHSLRNLLPKMPNYHGQCPIEIYSPFVLSSQPPSVHPGNNPSHKSHQSCLPVVHTCIPHSLSPFSAVEAHVHAASFISFALLHLHALTERHVTPFSD